MRANRDATIDSLFRAQVAATPREPAVTAGTQTLTYAELDRRAAAVAATLNARGLGRETPIGLCAERSTAMMVGLLGIIRAGCVYVPLDPDHPADRLAYILRDTAAPLVLTHGGLIGRSGGGVPTLDVEAVVAGTDPRPPTGPAPAAHPDDLAYIMYTSGSTGRPKGVCVPHRGIVNRLAWNRRVHPIGPGTTVLQKTPISFDVSAWELFWPLVSGARLVLARPGGHRDPAYLASLIRAEGVDVVHFVPSMLAQFVAEPATSGLTGVRQVMCSGEALPPDLANRASELMGAQVYNMYGPTEASVDVSGHAWRPDPEAVSVPIGTALDGVTLHVLGPDLEPVPAGHEGELFIGGTAVARGYHGQPGLTADRFVPDPHAGGGGRMYRTGDMVRELPDGQLDYLGRADHQVKINGNRIEPGEISSVLRRHPDVRDAVVVPYTDGQRKRLVAYVVPRPGQPTPGQAELHAWLARDLPAYMLPALYLPLAEVPLTTSGKVDRRALPPPRLTRAALGSDHVPPRTPAERTLVEVWRAVLSLDDIGVEDDFFALGGDSITALQIIVRARAAGLHVDTGQILGGRTIRRLARDAVAVGEPVGDRGDDEDPAFRLLSRHPGVEDAYPLTPMQAGMLFHTQFSEDSGDYHQQAVIEVAGPPDLDALAQALQDVVDAHPALRTRVHLTDVPAPAQVVLREFTLPLRRLDWRHLTADQRDGELTAFLTGDRAQAFAPTRKPPVRAALIDLGDRADVVLSHHHMLLDGWSLATLTEQLAAAYTARRAGERVRLPRRPYGRFSRWLAGQDAGRARAFWRDHLDGITEPTPMDLYDAGGAEQGGAVGEVFLDLAGAPLDRLRAAARAAGLTVTTLAHGIWAILLATYAGRRDVVFGSTVAGRPAELPDVVDTLGLFINSIPVRAAVVPDARLRDWLRELQRRLFEVREHAHAALPDIHAQTAVPRGTQLFDTIVIAQNQPAPSPAAAAAGIRLREMHERTGYPLVLMVEEEPGRIRFTLRHQLRALDAPTARRIAGHLRVVAEAFAADPDRRLADLTVLEPAERATVLAAGPVSYGPDDATIHGLFERQVRRTPQAVAVTYRGGELTYAALNARANRLARHLRNLGIGAEDLVGVAVERSPDLLVSLLAVMKAGAAYVPLATDNPPARLRAILEDAHVSAFVVQQRLRGLVDGVAGTVCAIDGDSGTIARLDGADLGLPGHADQLAYVIYTSGSSGRPKGVACHHRGLVNYLHFCAMRYAYRRDGGAPVFSSAGFDMIVPNLYTPLLLGQPVHLLPDGLDAADLAAELVRRAPFSFVKMTPGHLELLTRQLSPADAGALAGVLAVGADAFPAHVLADWRRLAPDVEVLNEYGPTEASVANAVYVADGPVGPGLLPIGTPIPNTTMYVLDGDLRPLPLGIAGEVYIGGVCPARGYLRQPDRTADRFLPDPYAGRPGARMYRTGDRGYRRTDGNVQFQGRLDGQAKIRGYRVETGEVEQRLVAHPVVAHAVVVARPDEQGRQRLVAYVVGTASTSELRSFLSRSLPEYCVPALYVPIAAVPLDANGKVDHRALPDPRSTDRPVEEAFVAPRDDVETRLAAVWAGTLGVERVGVHDNYFELGGDSIMTIQIVSAAAAAGLRVTPKQIFQHPTVATLATQARPVEPAGPAAVDRGVEDGDADVPLTPIQQWYLGRDLPRAHHYNQSVLLETSVADPEVLETALRAVVRRHPALRARFTRTGDGWRQRIAAREDAILLTVHRDAGDGSIEEVADRLHAGLDLSRGPLLRAAVVTAPGRPARLVVVAHHLAVDTVSWRFLIEDLARALTTNPPDAAALPAPSVTPAVWSAALRRRAADPAVLAQRHWWERLPRGALPRDHDLGPDLVRTAATVRVDLDEEDTRLLLRRAPAAHRVRVEDILLTALALTLREWAGRTVRVDVERHGRDHPLTGVDASRAVGWFTSVLPFAPELPSGGLGEALRATKEHLRAMPFDGFDHSVLRHLGDDPRLARLRRTDDAEVVFNYHGRGVVDGPAGPLRVLATACGAERPPDQLRTYGVEIEAAVRDGGLVVEWTYPTTRLAEPTVQAVAKRFLDGVRALSRYCVAHPGGHTAADFPLARITEDELRLITAGRGPVEDIYPLTPIQAGMLFATLLRPDEGLYVDQQILRLEGPIEPELFARAWAEAAGRHAILRTTVDWRGTAEPVQIVWRDPELPIRHVEQAVAFAEADRSAGFDEGALPWRLALENVGDRATAVLTYHHLLLDGWSVALLLRDVMTGYQALLTGEPPAFPPGVAFSRYVEWLSTVDTAEAGRYWAETLHDVVEPTPLPTATPRTGRHANAYARATLDRQRTGALRAYATAHRLTLATIANAAWSLVLGASAGRDDVVFGCTVSGRSTGMPGAEAVVGPLLNTLPARVRLDRHLSVADWCHRLQDQLLRLREHESSALVDIQAHSGIPRGVPLFGSVVVVETLPGTTTVGAASVTVVKAVESTEYPLVLNVIDRDSLLVELLYDAGRYDAGTAAALAEEFVETLARLTTPGDGSVGDLLDGAPYRRLP